MEIKNETYNKDVIEFVTVAVQFCLLAENSNQSTIEDFVDKMQKVLALLYLKALMLPDYESDETVFLQDFVEEDNYNIVRENIALVLGHYDDFLEVFVEDMKYSENPILCTVSENIADIYQDVKNFVMNFKHAAQDDVIYEAAAQCNQNFKYYWGQKLVNVLRPLHDIRYQLKIKDEDNA